VTARVYLIRHGATVLTTEDRFAGSTDVLLSNEGRDQAQRLADRLAATELAAVYASPLERAVETASILAAPHKLPVTKVPAFREIDHGRWEQRTRAEVEREFGEEYARWEADPYTFAPAGGETGLAVSARALPALLDVVAQHEEERILIVSHKATIRLLLSSLLGFDPRSYREHLDQSPAALNILDFKDLAHARLMVFNDTSHYCSEPALGKRRLSKVWG
jgi:probable phosphoglycerate mutase